MKPRSMQTRLQRKAAPAGANPYFAQGRGMQKKYTLHMYAKRSGVVHWDLSDKNADTNEIERVAREAVATGGRRGNTNLGLFGAEWPSITSN